MQNKRKKKSQKGKMKNLLINPSEPALKATESWPKQQSRSAAPGEASNLRREQSTSYNRRL